MLVDSNMKPYCESIKYYRGEIGKGPGEIPSSPPTNPASTGGTEIEPSPVAPPAIGGQYFGIRGTQRTEAVIRRPEGEHTMIELRGPAIFVAGLVRKSGGNSDITIVILDIDGRNVVNLTYAGAQFAGLTQYNPYGILLLTTESNKTLTIGFPSPLHFQRNLRLRVIVNEDDVDQIVANIIHGTELY